MSVFMVDVEADGPCAGLHSMVSFGVVRVQPEPLDCTFYGKVAPISETWVPEALAVSGFSREEHLAFEAPELVMRRFTDWLAQHSQDKPIFISDNPCFDWQYLNYYLWRFTGDNPFGHSGRRLGDLYCGLVKNWRAGSHWKGLRKTRHTHNPVDDARGNVEALLAMARKHELRKFLES